MQTLFGLFQTFLKKILQIQNSEFFKCVFGHFWNISIVVPIFVGVIGLVIFSSYTFSHFWNCDLKPFIGTKAAVIYDTPKNSHATYSQYEAI